MTTAIIGVILIFLSIIFSRPITTFIHELGHAIPSLLFTNGPVVIYVGSYGDISNSTKMTVGRLTIIFKFKLTDLQLGLCRHNASASIWQSIIIVLGGPIFSLLIAVAAGRLLQNHKEDQYMAFTIGIFLASGVIDFLANVIPSKQPLKMHDGYLTYNDGAQFVELLRSSRYPPVYFEAVKLLEGKEEQKAVSKFKESIDQGLHDLPVYQLVMRILKTNNQKDDAISFHEEYGYLFKLSSPDYVEMGQYYEEEDFDQKAIAHYSKAIKLDYTNTKALGLRGNLLLTLGQYEQGKADLKKVALMTGAK